MTVNSSVTFLLILILIGFGLGCYVIFVEDIVKQRRLRRDLRAAVIYTGLSLSSSDLVMIGQTYKLGAKAVLDEMEFLYSESATGRDSEIKQSIVWTLIENLKKYIGKN